MKTKKLLSILLALMMMLSVVPMYASAAEPITLTEANVTVWPTVSGEIYYGQKINEGITLSGGEVQYDGAVVAGHFEFIDPELRTNLGIPNLKFVPDDTTAYSVSEIGYAWDLMFTINKTTPVFVDANDTPVATEVASAGTLLGKSKISGGQVMNPYYPEEASVLGYTWSWVNRREPVTKSGYYEAQLGGGSYNTITTMIYVKIAGDTPETSIVETPTIPEFNYNPDITWADVEIIGGKAVINETEEVSGTFSISDSWKDKVPALGSYNVSVVFTPDDLTKASIYTMIIPVTVNKGQIKFVDENGDEIIPEITIKSAAVFGSSNIISAYLSDYLNATKITDWQYFDMDGNSLDGTAVPIGKHQYQVKVTSKDTNYEPTMLTFFLTLEPTYFNATTRYNYVNHYLTVVPDNKSVTDEFDVWVDGELIGTTTDQKIKWETDESRDYAVTLVHKDTTEGVYALANTEYTMTVKIPREIFRSDSGLSFTATGSTYPSNNNYAYKGDVLTLTCTDETFYNWQLSIGGEDWIPEGLTAEDLKKPTITFTMPDRDIFACPNDESRFAAAADCDHLCHSENPIYQFFWKILHFIFRLFNVQQYCDCGMKHYESPLFNF